MVAIGSIAGATLTTADLTRARVFYVARLCFPVLHEDGDAFMSGLGAGAITVRCELADPAGPRQSSLERIPLWCVSLDDLRAAAEALMAAGVDHSSLRSRGSEPMVFVERSRRDRVGAAGSLIAFFNIPSLRRCHDAKR